MTKRDRKSRAHVLDERLHARLLHLEEDLVVRAAAERQQAGLPQVVEIDHHARAETERADAAARLLRDDAADGERHAADEQRDRRPAMPSCESSSGRTSAPRFASSACENSRPSCSEHLPVERKARLHAAQLHHARDRRAVPVRRPHHRRHVDRLLAREDRRGREAASRDPRAPRASTDGWSRWRRPRAISARDSRVSPFRTVWIIERSATIAPTPIATQTKKNTSRRQDARISRHAIKQNKVHEHARVSVAQGDRLVGLRGQLRIVRDEHDGGLAAAVDVDQEIDDLVAGAGVEVPGRLVGQQDRGLVRERPRDRDALLLAARELRRIVMAARPEARLPTAARRRARRDRRVPAISSGTRTFSHAVSDGSRWKNWKTNPIRLPRNRARSSSDIDVMSAPSIDDAPGGRRVEPGQQPEQRRLPAARGADDRDDPAGRRCGDPADAGS